MKNRFTLLMTFCLTAITFLHAQTVETVATGMGVNFGMSVGGNAVYKRKAFDIVKADLSQPLPAPAVTLLAGVANLRSVLVAGDYLYITVGGNLPGLPCSVGRINLTVMNPMIEAVATNLTGEYATVGLVRNGNDLYIGATGATLNGLYKVNLATPFPQSATAVITGVSCFQIALHGNNMYFNDPSYSTISTFDIAQPTPAVTTVLSGGQMVGLTSHGNHLYFCDLTSPVGIKRIDVTQPVPVIETILPDQQNVNTLARDGNYLYFGKPDGTVSRAFLGPGEDCANANDINNLLGGIYNAPQISGLQDNTAYTSAGDPAVSSDCFADPVQSSIWYRFTGDGNTYRFRSVQCSATNYITLGDTQGAIFTGSCGSLTQVACNDDEDFPNSFYNFSIELVTVPGQEYHMLVDGYDGFQGEFCLEVTNLTQTAITFALGTTCSNVTATLGGASPTGGVYSGTGVTDTGDGNTFTFDPTAAGGPGSYTVTYTLANGSTATAALTVAAPPVIGVFGFLTDITSPASLLPDPEAGPAGGIYSGNGVLPGNIFDAGLAGAGVHLLTYTYTDANGCTGTGTGTISVNPAPHDGCADANDINNLFGAAFNVPQTSGLQDNTGYTSTGDPAVTPNCFFENDALQHTIWYTFTGDGNTYRIRSVQCSATNYITDGDTQAAIYTGDCDNLTLAACNDDENGNGGILNVSVNIETQAGQTYRMLIDGYSGMQGEFCLEVTNLSPSAVTEIGRTNIRLFPNPTTGVVQLANVRADYVQVFDNTGRLVMQVNQPGNRLDISAVPAGMYFLKIAESGNVYSARVVKE